MVRIGPRLTEIITVKRQTSHTSSGDPVRSTVLTVAARIERTASEATIADGREVGTGARVFTLVQLYEGDLVFFPEDNTSNPDTGHRVLEVVKRQALDGTTNHFTSRV